MKIYVLTGLVRKAEFAAQLAAQVNATVINSPEEAATLPADAVVVWPVPAEVHPENVLEMLDRFPNAEIRQIAMIDNRTCDCFPHLREMLEDHADLTLNYPFAIEEVIAS